MIYVKLNQLRKILHKANLKKTGKNTHAKYEFFELGDFLPVALAVMSELGICGVTDFSSASHAALRLIDTDDNTEVTFFSPAGTAALKGCHEIQNRGAEQTYHRRYLWIQALEIVEHDMIDTVTGSDKKTFATGSAIPPKKLATQIFETLSDADQAIVTAYGDEVCLGFENNEQDGISTYLRISDQLKKSEKGNELLSGLWSLLDSNKRRAIKGGHSAKVNRMGEMKTGAAGKEEVIR